MLTVNTSKVGYQAINGMLAYVFCIQLEIIEKSSFDIRISGGTFLKSENTMHFTSQWTTYAGEKSRTQSILPACVWFLESNPIFSLN